MKHVFHLFPAVFLIWIILGICGCECSQRVLLHSDAQGEGEGPEDMPADYLLIEDQGDDEGDESLALCGDGRPDPGEECDDGNDASGDGCEPSCTFSCHENSDCDDGNVCTMEQCVESGTGRICSFEFTTSTCDDGDPCTDGDRCDGRGGCTGEEITCPDDGNECTINHRCNHSTGLCIWDPAPDTTPCDDGDPATPMDRCSGIDDRCVAVIPTWAKTYGRTSSGLGISSEWGTSIRQTSDGGFVVVGQADWNGVSDDVNSILFKISENGNMEWQKQLASFDSCCSIFFIQPVVDGGYIALGTEGYSGVDYGYWVLRLDERENVVWQKLYHGSEINLPMSIQQTNDGGYIVSGTARRFSPPPFPDDAWILKLDEAGNVIWHKTYGNEGVGDVLTIWQTSSGSYMGVGKTASLHLLWIVTLDEYGNMQWQKTCDIGQGDNIFQVPDGGYIVSGDTDLFGAGSKDILVAKIDENGALLWYRTYGGPVDDSIGTMQPAVDGGYIFAGSTQSFGSGEEDVWVVRIDDLGNILWQKTYGGLDSDVAVDIQETVDGGYVVVGTTFSFLTDESDVWVLKMDSMGQISGTCPAGLGVDSAAVAMNHDVVCEDASVGQQSLEVNVWNATREIYDAVMSDATQCSR